MADVHTPEQRRLRSRDTKPERTVRSIIYRLGYRYRLHKPDLPGKPDIALVRHRKIVEVHGCFFHSHNCKYGRVQPATRPEFWRTKRSATVERDRRNRRALQELGWTVLTVWECEARDEIALKKRIELFLQPG
jgi:DNA mismatch endonuclease (patch repair protein)